MEEDVDTQKKAVQNKDKKTLGETDIKGAKDAETAAPLVTKIPGLPELAGKIAPPKLRDLGQRYINVQTSEQTNYVEEDDLMGLFADRIEALWKAYKEQKKPE